MNKIRFIGLLIAVSLLISNGALASVGQEVKEGTLAVQIYPTYLGDTDLYLEDGLPLYFWNDVMDLPFVELET